MGSQTLLGIAPAGAVHRAPAGQWSAGRVWPFEPPTGAKGEVVFAETYLSLFETGETPGVKDEAQVIDSARCLSGVRLPRLLARPYREPRAIWGEEGWTLGLVHRTS